MARRLSNKYSLSNLPDTDPHVRRVMQDLTDRINYLTDELGRVKNVVRPSPTSARRENPKEGIISLPFPGGPGFIRVNEDGVIASYTSPADDIFPYVDTRAVGNVGAGTDTLHTYKLRAGILANNFDIVKARYAGNVTASANARSINVTLDGQALTQMGAVFVSGTDLGWSIDVYIVRTSPTEVRTSTTLLINDTYVDTANVATSFGNGGFFEVWTKTLTVSNLNTVTMNLLVNAVGVADNDVVQRLSIIDRYKVKTFNE